MTVTVTNSGARDGDEVVQLYARAVDPRVPRPHRALVAHERRRLAAGQSGTFRFRVPRGELGHWDVAHGRWTVDPGTYVIEAGASSADIRLGKEITVDGPAPRPRPVLEVGLRAADFDSAHSVSLVDLSRVSGDAVAAHEDVAGQLLYRGCDFGPAPGPGDVLVETAGGGGTVELHLPDGTTVAAVSVPATGGPYTYTATGGALAARPTGVHDLHVTLRGALRLARLGFCG
ncbi:fibronectin type III-like domain-contianing protein [Streptomyces sp. GC420]|uniref:fibronectin type III-like domain-contianing protein n=1 Tax=Streptomyces sp. GC420 TaxID=2697568 RepID=UPI0028BD2A2A|nr:fibronectin type III-like domain-contianing protein [Streptomyces sp. GC420]